MTHMSCHTHVLSHTCHIQVFDETSEEIRQRMEDLASQAAEVQAASKALDLREQQLTVSAKPVDLCRLCRLVPLCSPVCRCTCLSVRVSQCVSLSACLLVRVSQCVSASISLSPCLEALLRAHAPQCVSLSPCVSCRISQSKSPMSLSQCLSVRTSQRDTR